MKGVIVVWLFFIATTLLPDAHASEVIKVAIIDNFKYQNYVTTKYKKYYMNGLELAFDQAKKLGLEVDCRVFQYTESPLSILKEVPELLEWKPDFVIGPRDSNKFLLLGSYLRDILTISPFATSDAIDQMPYNFFSMTLQDRFEARAIFHFVKWRYPKKRVIVITEVDCKSCVGVSDAFINIWNEFEGEMPTQQVFLSQQTSSLSLVDKVINNNGDKIIILPDNAHDSAVLMARISQLSSKKTIFVGGDGWGSWGDTEVGRLGELSTYEAYHVVPWGLELNNKDIQTFKRLYLSKYRVLPYNKLSYVLYQTAMSVFLSYKKYGNKFFGNKARKILQGYVYGGKKNGYIRCPSDYLVYQIYNGMNSYKFLVNSRTGKITTSDIYK